MCTHRDRRRRRRNRSGLRRSFPAQVCKVAKLLNEGFDVRRRLFNIEPSLNEHMTWIIYGSLRYFRLPFRGYEVSIL